MKLLFRRVGILLFLLTVSACVQYPHYLIESKYMASGAVKASKEPEIITTERFKNNEIKKLAMLAPRACTEKNHCRSGMRVLERELVKHGYQVISWEIVKRKVSVAQHNFSEKKSTPLGVAMEVGADVLFQVNSFELYENTVANSGWKRMFYQSNENGDKNEVMQVGNARKKIFSDLIHLQEEPLGNRAHLNANIDITVTDVWSKEAIWFGQWTYADQNSEEITTSLLVKCDDVKHICKKARRSSGGEEKNYNEDKGVVKKEAESRITSNLYKELINSLSADVAEKFSDK